MPTPAPVSVPTPREVFTALAGLLSAGRWDEVAALYAEDAVAELPFALPVPDRVEGRATLHERFTALGAGNLEMVVENIRVHETADPEVIVAEFETRGKSLTTGRAFHLANIQVLRVRDGLIAHTRDFHDHAALAVATGRMPALDAALGGGFALDRVPDAA